MNRDENFRRFQDDIHQARQLKLLKLHWWRRDLLSPKVRGRLRERSFCDCGITRCPMCGNPRYNKNLAKTAQLTRDELRYIDKFNEELKDLCKNNDPIVSWLKD